jgi:membrane fusion protein (multidrug efflux system)
MKTKYIVYTLIFLLFAYLIYNRLSINRNDNTSKKGGETPSAILVDAIIVKEQDFANKINLSGTLEANEQIEIRSEVSGLVRQIYFTEGSNVSAGELLVKIDDKESVAQLSQATTKEKLAADVQIRATKLLKVEAISIEEFDNVSAELKSLKAQTQLIRAQIARTEIRAPFSGKIGLRYISKGAYVNPTTDIANLISINPIKIIFSVPEKYAQLVKMGSNIQFTIAGNTKFFNANVYAKEPSIDIATRSLILKARAINNTGELLPGSFANINLTLETINKAFLIPTDAVIPVLKGKQVFLLKDGKAKAIAIKSEIRTDENILVSEGLQVGDTVITTGIMAIKDNAPVKVKIKAN